MTTQNEVIKDPKYLPVLDHGFVGLTEYMGSDSSIVQSARVSYAKGTKQVNEDRGLIRYLLSHKHTTPFEMVEFRFHCKMPIFVARQWIRHRTANVNEMSARYSVLPEEFYMPELDAIKPQSVTNKQGRDGNITEDDKVGVKWLLETANKSAYEIYEALLGEDKEKEHPYDAYVGTDPLLSMEFPGLARELARTVLPVSYYTEWYWKIDLHNLMHFLKLRLDTHAQYEIRIFADAMYTLIKDVVPLAVEAFEDYVKEAKTFSRMEMELLFILLDHAEDKSTAFAGLVDVHGSEKALAEARGMNIRELNEFKTKIGI